MDLVRLSESGGSPFDGGRVSHRLGAVLDPKRAGSRLMGRAFRSAILPGVGCFTDRGRRTPGAARHCHLQHSRRPSYFLFANERPVGRTTVQILLSMMIALSVLAGVAGSAMTSRYRASSADRPSRTWRLCLCGGLRGQSRRPFPQRHGPNNGGGISALSLLSANRPGGPSRSDCLFSAKPCSFYLRMPGTPNSSTWRILSRST
jgi:hypothetical protein